MEKPITISLWTAYTQEELREKGSELSSAVIDLSSIEVKKKAASDDFKIQIEAVEGQMYRLSREIREKGCNSPTPCIVRFHFPRIAFKQIIRVDTGELVREEQMTPYECQENLFETKELDELRRMMDKPEPPAEQK